MIKRHRNSNHNFRTHNFHTLIIWHHLRWQSHHRCHHQIARCLRQHHCRYLLEWCLSHLHWQDRHGGCLFKPARNQLTTVVTIAWNFQHQYGRFCDQWNHQTHLKSTCWWRRDHKARGLHCRVLLLGLCLCFCSCWKSVCVCVFVFGWHERARKC